MTVVRRLRPRLVALDEQRPAARSSTDWIDALTATGQVHDAAVRSLHELMLRAARHQVAQMYSQLPALGGVRIDDIVHQAADDATVALLGKLASFEGRSRFTTWAYKFGILHAAVEVRRNMWRHRELTLDLLAEPATTDTSPEQFVEATDFSAAVSAAIDRVLTAHQRRVVLALLIENMPIDVLADRLGTNRNALYKTLYDARALLRKDLTVRQYLSALPGLEVTS